MKNSSKNRHLFGVALAVLALVLVAGVAKGKLERKATEVEIRQGIREWRTNMIKDKIKLIKEGRVIPFDLV
jgi:hypothetical protein